MTEFTLKVAIYYVLIIFVLIPLLVIIFGILKQIPCFLRKILKILKRFFIYIWEELQKPH